MGDQPLLLIPLNTFLRLRATFESRTATTTTGQSPEGSEQARDLVDLQLLDKGEDLDLAQVKATCVRLFEYRRQQPWPPIVVAGEGWYTLYEAAVEDIDALREVGADVAWVNAFVARIDAAASRAQVWQKCGRTTNRDRPQPTVVSAFAQVNPILPTPTIKTR